MTESVYEQIAALAKQISVTLSSEEIASLAEKNNMSDKELKQILAVFGYLAESHKNAITETCIRLSRLPKKNPKTFSNFDFSRIHGKDVDVIKNLPALSQLYSHKNIAFIGPQGVGKTHLAMAYGYACCELGLKTYFVKANELNQRLTNARKLGTVEKVTTSLVKPSCLIIDEVGRCTFDEWNTQIFFDIVDRRYMKEGSNCMIITSNKNPNTWGKYFIEQDAVLGAMDRFFDDSLVCMIKGDSYRGRKTQTASIEAGDNSTTKK